METSLNSHALKSSQLVMQFNLTHRTKRKKKANFAIKTSFYFDTKRAKVTRNLVASFRCVHKIIIFNALKTLNALNYFKMLEILVKQARF